MLAKPCARLSQLCAEGSGAARARNHPCASKHCFLVKLQPAEQRMLQLCWKDGRGRKSEMVSASCHLQQADGWAAAAPSFPYGCHRRDACSAKQKWQHHLLLSILLEPPDSEAAAWRGAVGRCHYLPGPGPARRHRRCTHGLAT